MCNFVTVRKKPLIFLYILFFINKIDKNKKVTDRGYTLVTHWLHIFRFFAEIFKKWTCYTSYTSVTDLLHILKKICVLENQ